MRQLRPRLRLELQLTEEKPVEISVLINSIYYFIESAMIVAKDGVYRLLVIHQNRLLMDKYYKTAKGAKIAFIKSFAYKAWEEDVKTLWTPFYPPDRKWLDERMKENEERMKMNDQRIPA